MSIEEMLDNRNTDVMHVSVGTFQTAVGKNKFRKVNIMQVSAFGQLHHEHPDLVHRL
jgi:hypothetical protein